MRLIITGGCGFVGFNLAARLKRCGHTVTAVDNLARRGSEINLPALKALGIEFIHADIRNWDDVAHLPRPVDVLIECSAQPSVVSGFSRPLYDFNTNVMGAVHCLEFCRLNNAGMIFLSSSRIYASNKMNALPREEKETRWDWAPKADFATQVKGFDPVRGIGADFDLDGPTKTIYGASKAAADFFCQEYCSAFKLPIIVNRCGVLAGEGQFGVVGQGWLTYWAMAGVFDRPLTYYGHKGKQVRDVLFIPDFCSLIEKQLAQLETLSGGVWNVGGGRENSLSLIEATSLVDRMLGKEIATSYTDQAREADVVIYITDNTSITRDLNWAPNTGVEQGLERIIRWVNDNRTSLQEAGL
jgi:CDP-paratose 2-epimerase